MRNLECDVSRTIIVPGSFPHTVLESEDGAIFMSDGSDDVTIDIRFPSDLPIGFAFGVVLNSGGSGDVFLNLGSSGQRFYDETGGVGGGYVTNSPGVGQSVEVTKVEATVWQVTKKVGAWGGGG